jgi:hypothetical protein
MADPVFRLVSLPTALLDAAPEWARELLADGELALLPGDGGLDDVGEVARRLDLVSVAVLRGETSPEAQDETVIAWASAMPLVWVGAAFSPRVRGWAQERGPMTLLVESGGPLPADEQRRIARFAATLGRQSE